MSATTVTPAAGFNLGAPSSTNTGFGGVLSSFQSSPGTSTGSSSTDSEFDPGGLSVQQLAADINNDSFENLSGAMSPSQLTADPNYSSTTSADYQGTINPDDIDFDGTPLSQLGIGEGSNAYGQTLLGSGYANPGLTYDGQPISNAQQNAAYDQLADSQTHDVGKELGTAALGIGLGFVTGGLGFGAALAGDAGLEAGGLAAGIVGGAANGALAGGIMSGVTGGNIGKGILDGAIAGGVGGGVSSSLSGAVSDGDISSTTSAAIKGAASAGTGALLNGGQGGFGSVLTGAAIGGASGGVTSAATDATGSNFLGGVAGGLTSAGLDYANMSSQLPSQNSRPSGSPSTSSSSGTTPTPASGFNIANPLSVGANQIGTSSSMPTSNAPTDGAFNLGINTKQS